MFDDAITFDKIVVVRKFGKPCQQLKSTSAIERVYVRLTRESLVGRNFPSECEAKYYYWNKMSIPSDMFKESESRHYVELAKCFTQFGTPLESL